MFTYRIKWVNA